MHLDEIVKNLPALSRALMVAILFIQSGLDKVFDWKGNVEWLKGHFSKTFVAGLVPLMLAKITIIELATGVPTAAGIVYFLVAGSTAVIFWASSVGAPGSSHCSLASVSPKTTRVPPCWFRILFC